MIVICLMFLCYYAYNTLLNTKYLSFIYMIFFLCFLCFYYFFTSYINNIQTTAFTESAVFWMNSNDYVANYALLLFFIKLCLIILFVWCMWEQHMIEEHFALCSKSEINKNFIYKQCQYIYDVWIQWMSMVKR